MFKTVQVSGVSDIAYSQIRDDFWYANYLGLQVIMMKSAMDTSMQLNYV